MPYELLATSEFAKDYRKLPPEVARRVAEALDGLAANPERLRLPLKYLPASLKGLHKYRVGDYRVLLWPDHEQQQLVLYAVAHRREIYRRLARR